MARLFAALTRSAKRALPRIVAIPLSGSCSRGIATPTAQSSHQQSMAAAASGRLVAAPAVQSTSFPGRLPEERLIDASASVVWPTFLST